MKVAVCLVTRQHDGEETQESRIESHGFLTQETDGLLLRYKEPQNEEAYGASVRMTVRENAVLIERQGPISARMPLSPRRKQMWQYDTPYGAMELSVSCTEFCNELTAAGGRFYAAYIVETTSAEGADGMACTMEILVKEVSE